MTFEEWYQRDGIDIAKIQGVWTAGGMTLANSAWDAALEEAAKIAEDCIANGVVVLSAGEVADAIRQRKTQEGT